MKHVHFGLAFSLAAISGGCGDSAGTGGAGGSATVSTTTVASTAQSSSHTSTSQATTTTSTSLPTSSTGSTSSSGSSSTASTSVASSSSTGGNPNVTEVPCNGATLSATVVTTPSFLFSPALSTIPVGGVVEFAPGIEHAVAADDSSFFVDGGDVKCFAFSAAGAYPFHCAIHPFMTGSITAQ